MDEIIELLSDEEDDDTSNYSDEAEKLQTDLSAILKKYEKFDCLNKKEPKRVKINNDISPETSANKLNESLLNINQLNPNPTNLLLNKKIPISEYSTVDIELVEQQKYDKPKRNKRKALISDERVQEKLRKEQEKRQKREEKERLKAINAEAKAKKLALAAAYKNLKPEECVKFVTTLLDSDLISAEYGTEIPLCLQTSDVKFRIISQIIPNVITWVRDTQEQLTDNNGLLGLSKEKDDCEEIIFVMLWNEFVDCINKNNLCEQLTIKKSLFPNKIITLVIYGLGNYLRFQKNKKTQSKKDQIYVEAPKVSRKDIEMNLIELQILIGISNRFLESSKDLGNMIAQFTKSIAQKPYKLQKQLKSQEMDWYVAGCNKDSVRVDKSGNGLMRLWSQQLTQFALARLETAEAICTKYPSPFTLMKAYDECPSQREGEKLLQELPIRRAAGPLTSVRKLGPELSKKVYTVFTSLDGNLVV